MAVTYSVRISGGGIDSFLGFEYSDVITLVSREFRVLLPILPTSLRFLHIFGFVGVAGVANPPLLPNLTIYSRVVPLLGFRLVVFVRATVELASVAAPILLLALRSAAAVAFFSPVSQFSRWFGVF